MEKNNLELWSKVEKTNPNYTKKANVKGNNITSISPQFQIKNATEQFGSYGTTWGFKNMNIDYTLKELGLVAFKALFYYPGGEFETINSIQLYRDNAMTKIDDNFAKKLETDTLTKALSKLGFNADIFLGKFDDIRYLEEVTKEFAEPKEPIQPTQAREIKQGKPQFTEAQFENAKNANATIEQIKSKYSITSEMETKFNNYVTA
jgi:hypothetical protein